MAVNRIDEVVPSVFRVQQWDEDRWVCSFVVRGDELTLIVDAGVAGMPSVSLLPMLRDLGSLSPEQPLLILVTHPDSDHCGGVAEIVAEAPWAEVAAHEHDADA